MSAKCQERPPAPRRYRVALIESQRHILSAEFPSFIVRTRNCPSAHRASDIGDDIMKFPRRKFLHLAAGAAVLPTISHIASALDYPTRPVRWIVGFPPGGPNDITARIMAEFLSERLHQQFAVENRPGAGSNLATESVAKAQPDGYTVMELATSDQRVALPKS
jgi:Tripartite tricarboxylate transporter family receptor